MAENKIVPLGGVHKTVSSLLAEIMNDPKAKKCVIFTFDGDGLMQFAHVDVTRMEMAYAASIAMVHATEGEFEKR